MAESSTLPLTGLRVVTTANALPTAVVGQILADAGAEVWALEPPTGSVLRSHASWDYWTRGQRSLSVDLKTDDGRATARRLVRNSDVFVDGWGTGVAACLGLAADDLVAENPRLIHARISAFGDESPLVALQGWESIVMATVGGSTSFSNLTPRPGPSFVSTPFCSISAAHLAAQGILGALVERERSGQGQRVSATLAQGLLAFDTWNWLIYALAERYSQAFQITPQYDFERLVPNGTFVFRLLVGLSKDGHWLQFSQTTDRLYAAFLRGCGLDPSDPAVQGAAQSEDPAIRVELWETLLAAVRSRTVDEWAEFFDIDADVWAERYRFGPAALEHPQLVADERTVLRGDGVRVPSALALSSTWPQPSAQHGPSLGADNDEVPDAPLTAPARDHSTPDHRPALDGVTILELGTFYAAPYGATLLAEQGARVIKVEPPDGDPLRYIGPFPEIAGVKVLAGKESVALDLTTERGYAALCELVRRADVVLQGYRGGVAERMRCAPADLHAINPDLIYVSAPGYSDRPPCGHRPAFAPTMGAASGIAMRNLGGIQSIPTGPDLSLEVVKRTAFRLASGAMGYANADGFAALGVGTSMLLALAARARNGTTGTVLRTSMLATASHALADTNIVSASGTPTPAPDNELYGLGPYHRLYETSDGWIMLTAHGDVARAALAECVGVDLNGADPAAVLAQAFRGRAATTWQEALTAKGVTCAVVSPLGVERTVMLGELGATQGWVTSVSHPTFGEHPRTSALTRFSRSRSVIGTSQLVGESTESVLAELGMSGGIADLPTATKDGDLP